MARSEPWYRSPGWGPRIEADFFKRLARCRSDSDRIQNTLIKAWTLQESGDRARIRAAIKLARNVLDHWPDCTEAANAHAIEAACRLNLGDLDGRTEVSTVVRLGKNVRNPPSVAHDLDGLPAHRACS